MPLDKQIAAIPLTGGLDTMTCPLAQAPGSFLQLDDVRQERLHEWRNRQGITHANALDDVPGTITPQPPLISAQLPGLTGIVALSQLEVVSGASDKSSALVYDRNTPSSISRWQRKTPYYDAPLAAPGVWSMSSIAGEALPTTLSTVAVGVTGARLLAWDLDTDGITSSGIRYIIVDANGIPLMSPGTTAPATTFLPRAVYINGFFLLFYMDASDAKLYVLKFSEATATVTGIATVLKTNADTTGIRAMDAIVYGGSATATVVYRDNGGFAHQLEVNPTTLALTADASLAVNCFNALALLPDPDNSGFRFVGVCTNVPTTRILTTTSGAGVTLNEQFSATQTNQIAGCAYMNGTGWLAVARTTAGGIQANKKNGGSGIVGTAINLVPGGSYLFLDSNAWREPGTDTMRYILGVHQNVGTDYQQTYYEMALEYDAPGANVLGAYRTPQAVLAPLNAAPGLIVFQPSQVSRISGQTFLLALPRVSNPKIASGTPSSLYTVDLWSVRYMTPDYLFTRPNLGTGITGPQCAYLPAGTLLQCCTGQRVEGHGASMLPITPLVTPVAGAGLNAGQVYNWKVSIDYPDERGNVWRGPRSTAVTLTPTAGNLQANVTALLPPLDSPTRNRIVNFWRTLGNGSVYQLVRQLSADGSTSSIGFTDAIPDTQLAQSNFEPVGLEAGLTPAFNHLAFFDGRMWGAERDFPRRLRFTRKLQIGISPEFPPEFFIDLEDEYGDITGLAALDDKLIIGKDSAVYFTPEGGPADDGTGGTYNITRFNSEIGFERGTPYVSTGSHVWFFHHGVQSLDRSLKLNFVGKAIDKWFNQPLTQSPETPISMTYNHRRDEIRLLTNNYRFVYDLDHECWIRDTGGPAGTLGMQTLDDTGDMFFQSNGQVWWDYDIESLSSTADANGSVQGFMKSPWLRPAEPEGYIRLYSTRTVWSRDPASSTTLFPVTTVYFNDDDTLNEVSAPVGTSGVRKQTIEMRTARQKCTSFAVGVQLPAGDLRWRVAHWSVMFAIKQAQIQR